MNRRLLVILCLVASAIGCAGPDRLVYYPEREVKTTPAAVALQHENVTLTTSDGLKLSAWWVPAARTRGTVLFCHGNAGNLSHCLGTIRLYNEMGFSVMAFDYRGFGKSEGNPSERGTYLDAESAWTYLTTTRGAKEEEIVVVGRSLGGGVASYLAEKHSPRAVVLESTFTSVGALANEYSTSAGPLMMRGVSYDTLSRMPDIHCPVLVIHSPQDEVIPFGHGRSLFAAANEPKQFIRTQGGHNEDMLGLHRPELEKFFLLCGLTPGESP